MKYVCGVCGYVYDEEAEGKKFDELAADWVCPTCKASKDKFIAQGGERSWAAEHVLGIAADAPEEIKAGLREMFHGECTEVGMYLAMGRVAIREGYPEIGAFYEKAAWEEAEHAAHFAELLGEELTDSTKKNLQLRADAECGATQGRVDLAKKAKELNLDAIHDIVHEIGRDEARHGRAFEGLLKRYFG
ncbi:MAG: rubredoxin [Lachnospiraceae bacterium]|nr:rubredoxin [Lachnospiraceae bacterium]